MNLTNRIVSAAAGVAVLATAMSGLAGNAQDGTAAVADTAAAQTSETQTSEIQTSDSRRAEPQPYVPRSKAELKRALTPMQFNVTQNEGTEPAFQNKYWNNKKPGQYRCIVCAQPLFNSDTKYDSGTGWPSYFAPIDEQAIGLKQDWKLLYSRTEVHCSRCEAHLGHVFNDGPAPTGKRYCMNSASLDFKSQAELKAEADAAAAGGGDNVATADAGAKSSQPAD